VLAVVGLGAFALWRGRAPEGAAPASNAAADAAPGASDTSKDQAANASTVSTAADAAAAARAAIGPHKQTTLPPIPFQGYEPPRPVSVVTAAYEFAAEHPEVLTYIPCFCGCERGGHRGNEDCFVKARAANGDVVEWEPHGLECAVCIDVATRSRQMHASGASVRDIRAAVEKEFAANSPLMTPTPKPPAHDH
jgi:hypothetical protein